MYFANTKSLEKPEKLFDVIEPGSVFAVPCASNVHPVWSITFCYA
jgi:hypothetical protein